MYFHSKDADLQILYKSQKTFWNMPFGKYEKYENYEKIIENMEKHGKIQHAS